MHETDVFELCSEGLHRTRNKFSVEVQDTECCRMETTHGISERQ